MRVILPVELIQEIWKSKFVRNIVTLISGKATSQIIAVLTIPIIARLFDPVDFGIAALFWSMTLIGAGFCNFGYDQAVLLPKEDRIAVNLAAIAMGFTIVTTIVIYIFIPLLNSPTVSFQWMQQLEKWLYVLPLAIFLLGVIRVLNSYATRKGKFRAQAVADVSEAGIVSSVRLVTGFMGVGVAGLIASLLLGVLIKASILIANIGRFGKEKVSTIKAGELREVATKYHHFPLYTMPTGLLNIAAQHLPVVALAIIFNPAVVGLYSMGNRLLQLPVGLFAESVRRTYLQRIAQLVNDGQPILALLTRVTLGLSVMGATIFLPIFFYGEELFQLVLGSAWREAGVFAKWLAPLLFMMFIRSPSSATFVVLRRQNILLLLHFINIIGVVLVFYAALYFSFSPEKTIICYSLIGILSSCIIVGAAFALTINYSR